MVKFLTATKTKNKNWNDIKAVRVYREFSSTYFKKYKALKKLPEDLVSISLFELLFSQFLQAPVWIQMDKLRECLAEYYMKVIITRYVYIYVSI